MFERRLKVFLLILFAMTGVLVLRAAQVQIVQRAHWQARADSHLTSSRLLETVRGKILDVKGRDVAIDRPCIDACVDFRALTTPPNPDWVRRLAAQRLLQSLGDGFKRAARAKRTEMLDAEVARVNADIETMWARLAKVSGVPEEHVIETRDAIVEKIKARRRYVWYRNYEAAARKHEQRAPAPAWRRFLVDDEADAPTPEKFATLTVEDELASHAVLKSVDAREQNEIRKHIERFPGLTLRAGIERYYPFHDAGCHLLGNIARVTRQDLVSEWNAAAEDLRQYQPNDTIGRSGIEALAEPLLRGTRGRVETVEGRESPSGRVEPVRGADVRITIDMDLQADAIELFRRAMVQDDTVKPRTYTPFNMHGGLVVIDVPTGEVLALASNPTFDLNEFDERYAEMARDELDLPMLNRATQVAREPGSTIKPVVGLAGIAAGVVGVHEGIECNGFMMVNGRRIPHGKCWTQSMFGTGYHQTPSKDPHMGSYGNPDGHLTFAEAVQRSCNVYFETIGDRLNMDGLSLWYERFGLGRPVGLGIPEIAGRLPNQWTGLPSERRFATWISAIGQSSTLATPVQMANVAATIARDGVWVRPRLIRDGQGLQLPGAKFGPPRVDLKLPRAALKAARDGMIDVVNTRAGSAQQFVYRSDLLIAGKTGTAEAVPVRVKQWGPDGKELRDAKGNFVRRELVPASPQRPNEETPWYRGFGPDGTTLKHSWFIGFAPADKPKLAFAVMLEYGGSGGSGAGMIANELIGLLIERKYLETTPNAAPLRARGEVVRIAQPVGDGEARPASATERGELLEPEVGD